MSSRRWIAGIISAAILLGIVCWSFAGTSAAQLLQKGNAALAKNDVPLAVACAERLVVKSPRLAAGWKLLAEAAGRQGEWDRACEALEEYARLRPSEAGHLAYLLGRDWMGQNRIRPALRALKVSEKHSPEPVETWHLQETIAIVTGHRQEANRCIMERIKRGVATEDELFLAVRSEPLVNDAERLDAILQADPAYKSPLLGKAVQSLNQDNYEEAESLLLEIITAHPEDTDAQCALGELYAVFLPDKFLAWHHNLPAEGSDESRVWSARGKWLAETGRIPEAIHCLHESLIREPELTDATSLLGQLLKLHHEPELGNAFTERHHRQMKIIGLTQNWLTPKRSELLLTMMEELEATGRLWEAWGHGRMHGRTANRDREKIAACMNRIEPQLHDELPRTKPESLPGIEFDWERFPLPDWSRFESKGH